MEVKKINISFSSTSTKEVKEMKPWQGVLFGIVFSIIGIFLIFFSIKTIKEYKEKNETYVETTAVVIDYDMNSDGLEAIIVEYTVNGEAYKKVSNIYSNNPKDIGSSVSVKYNPNNPKDAIWTNDSINVILPISGVLFTGIGIFVVISSIKKSKNQKLIGQAGILNVAVVNQSVTPEVAPVSDVNNTVNTSEVDTMDQNMIDSNNQGNL